MSPPTCTFTIAYPVFILLHTVLDYRYAGSFTMDVIVSTSFGLKIDSQKDKNNQFVAMAKKAFTFNLPNLAYLVTCKYILQNFLSRDKQTTWGTVKEF